MNKQNVEDDSSVNMHRSAMKAYSDMLALKNDSPDTVKIYSFTKRI